MNEKEYLKIYENAIDNLKRAIDVEFIGQEKIELISKIPDHKDAAIRGYAAGEIFFNDTAVHDLVETIIQNMNIARSQKRILLEKVEE